MEINILNVVNPSFLQFIKYALAGGVSTITHIIIFHIIAWKIFPSLQEKDHSVRFFNLTIQTINNTTRARNSMIGNFIAFIIATMVAYITNILFVFQGGKYKFFIEICLFYLISGVSVFIGTMLMGTLIRRFGLLTTNAFVANIFIALMFNYVMRKFFIFNG